MKRNEWQVATAWSARRAALKLTLAGVLAAGLSACGGGGGGDSSDDSKDLRAAIDRLKAGMTYEDVVAAVGWEPNVNRNGWSHDYLSLQVSFRIPPGGSIPLIDAAQLTGRIDTIDRNYR